MNYLRPLRGVWEVSLACNMRCLHCGTAAGSARHDELSDSELLSVCDQLAQIGCESIALSGGEILIKKGWEKIAQRLASLGIKVEMVSNGYLVPENIDKILAHVNNIGISIDGTSKTHNYMRQVPDSFEKALIGIREIKKCGKGVGVVTQVNQLNIDELDEIYKILLDAGVDYWQLQIAFELGRLKTAPQIVLDRARIPSLADFIIKVLHEEKLVVYAGDNIGYYTQYEDKLRHSPWNGCPAGLWIGTNGRFRMTEAR